MYVASAEYIGGMENNPDSATEPEPEQPAKRSGLRSGAIALIASVALVVWIVGGAYLAIFAATSDVVGVIATIVFFASWVVIPGLVITIIVCAIIALLFNRVPGKIMAAFAIVLPVVAGVLIWTVL